MSVDFSDLQKFSSSQVASTTLPKRPKNAVDEGRAPHSRKKPRPVSLVDSTEARGGEARSLAVRHKALQQELTKIQHMPTASIAQVEVNEQPNSKDKPPRIKTTKRKASEPEPTQSATKLTQAPISGSQRKTRGGDGGLIAEAANPGPSQRDEGSGAPPEAKSRKSGKNATATASTRHGSL